MTEFNRVAGARDMLREAAKQFRLYGNNGHAVMCDRHADSLDTATARSNWKSPVETAQ